MIFLTLIEAPQSVNAMARTCAATDVIRKCPKISREMGEMAERCDLSTKNKISLSEFVFWTT